MDAKELQSIVEELFEARGASGKQEPTGALGVFGNKEIYSKTILLYASQSGPMPGNLKEAKDALLVDARDHVSSKLKKGEWACYHAEMIIVSAMLKMLRVGNIWKSGDNLGIYSINKYMRLLGTAIAANAPCCKHCYAMLTSLGIDKPEPAGPSTLTGWWNPLTDKAYPNASSEFKEDIPGGLALSESVRKYFE